VGNVPFTIVCVARPEFFGVVVGEAAEVWMAMSTLPSVFPGQPWFDSRMHYLNLLGRLQPGLNAAQASAALTPLAVATDLALARPNMPARFLKQIREGKLKLEPAAKGISYLRTRFSTPLRVLFTMVGIVLLLACVNVMSLGFARAEGRRTELRVRLAIGAARARIVRQLVTEALVVALAGGALGLAIYRPAAIGLASLLSQTIDPRLNVNMLLYVFAISVAAGLVCGVAPALGSTRAQGSDGLQYGSRGATPPPARRAVGRAAAAVQMALSVVLIAGAFLFAFSLRKLTSFNTGLDRRRLVVVDVDAKDVAYKGPQIAALNRRVLDHLGALPGVASASFSGNGIYTDRNSNTAVVVDGFPQGEGDINMTWLDHVGPHYFATAGTRLVLGRDFDERDNRAGPGVVIVNQEFVNHFFSGQDPLGKNLYRRGEEQRYQIVGVVQDIRTDVRQTPKRMMYFSQLQTEGRLYTTRFLVRMRTGQEARMADLRAAVRAADPAVHLASIDSADDLLNHTLDTDRAIAALSFGFGILAITLAAAGIYGLLAHDVTRRTGEIGVRMALGATRPGVMALVFREVALVGALGIVAGMAGAIALGRLVTGMVFGLKPGDPRVLIGAITVLAVVAVIAAWFPARRAASMDPTAALRHE
jgi:predicted permease